MLLFFILLTSFHFENDKGEVKETVILFFNSNKNYGVGINRQSFWRDTESHDTIIISDFSYNKLIYNQFSLLKDTVLFGGDDYLRCGVAFIRHFNNGCIDTFYSSPTLNYFRNNQGKEYVDTAGFFKKNFRGFFIYD